MGPDREVVRRRGRPPAAHRRRRFKVTLSLHPVLDAALIEALERAPEGRRSALVREWLRSGFRPDGSLIEEEAPPDLEELGLNF